MEGTLEQQQIEIAGKKYLTDFSWLNVDHKRTWETEAKNRSERHGRPLCLLRIGRYKREPFQYGLHENITDCKTKKLPRSLALSVVNGFPGRNYLGFFAVGGGYWVCAVQNAQFMLNGDMFFTNKEEADEAFEDIRNKFQWTESTVFDFSASEEESLAEITELIEKNEYANRTGYINFAEKKKVNYGAIILVLLALIGGGVYMYKDELFPKEIIPPQPANVLFPLVWEKEPLAWDVYMACEDALNSIPISDMLWTMKDAVCTKNNLKAVYIREKEGSYLHRPKDTKLDMNKLDIATRTIPVKVKSKRPKMKLLPQRKTYLELREYFRLMAYYRASASLNSVAPARKMDGDPPVNVQATYGSIRYKITVSEFPREIFHYIAKMPGTTLDSVKTYFSTGSLRWEFSGVIYVNP